MGKNVAVQGRLFRIALGLILSFSLVGNGVEASVATGHQASREINREKMLLLLSGEWVSRALYVATKLKIADHLKSESKSVDDLAKLTQSDSESLYRLLHMLAGFQVFDEVAPRVFANTDLSSLLAKSDPDTLHALSLFYGEDIHRAWDGLLSSIETGTPAFQLIFQQPVFKYFKENPNRGALFQESMKEKSLAVIKSSLSSYDFSRFQSVYDIGGGYGQFMHTLLKNYPDIRGTLFELPEVIATIKQRNQENNSCALIAGDFFESVPKGGDAYILKSVLHDWDDQKCGRILQNCYSSMDANSRLLIIEVVLQPKAESLYANCMDVLMLAITGGKERSVNSFQQMLESSGFVLERIYPTATEFSILEARKVVQNSNNQQYKD